MIKRKGDKLVVKWKGQLGNENHSFRSLIDKKDIVKRYESILS